MSEFWDLSSIDKNNLASLGFYQPLENLLFDTSEINQLSYAALPDRLKSGILENYANWLYCLTAQDPKHFERCGCAQFDPSINNIKFANMVLKGKGTVNFSAFANSADTVLMHSHPDDTTFSTNDIASFLAHLFSAFSVASSGMNFLILKTKDTEGSEIESTWGMTYDQDIQEIRNFFSYANRYGTGLDESEFRRLKWLSGVNTEYPHLFDEFYYLYYHLFLNNFYYAKIHKYGLYYSRKDGEYLRVTKEFIKEYILSLILERFAQAQKRMSR